MARYDPVDAWYGRKIDSEDLIDDRRTYAHMEGCRVGNHSFKCSCGCDVAESCWQGTIQCSVCWISVPVAPQYTSELPYHDYAVSAIAHLDEYGDYEPPKSEAELTEY